MVHGSALWRWRTPVCVYVNLAWTLQWRHNGRDGISNHQPHDCLLNRLFRCRSKKTSKLRVTGLCAGNSPVTGEFPAQMASNAKNASIWWRHHGKYLQVTKMTSMRVEQSYRGVSYTTMTTTIGLNNFIWFTAQLWYTYIMSYLIYNFSWQVDKMPTWPWCCRSLSVFLLVSTLTSWTFDGYFYFLFVPANKICLDNLLHKYHFEENNVLERECCDSRHFRYWLHEKIPKLTTSIFPFQWRL